MTLKRAAAITGIAEMAPRASAEGLSTMGIWADVSRRAILDAGLEPADIDGLLVAPPIVDGQGNRIACGITNYSSEEIQRIRGIHSDKIEEVLGHHYGSEVLHRNNMVLL